MDQITPRFSGLKQVLFYLTVSESQETEWLSWVVLAQGFLKSVRMLAGVLIVLSLSRV